jgi:hypothetical protein
MKPIKNNICVIAEFPWQIENIVAMKNLAPNVLAMNPQMVFLLEEAGISAVDARSLYSHDQLWSRYPETNNLSDQLCIRIDQILFDIDSRISSRNLKLFNKLTYHVKIISDQIYYFIFILNLYFKKYEITKVLCAPKTDITQRDSVEISHTQSLVAHIIELFIPTFSFKVFHMEHPQNAKINFQRTLNKPFSSLLNFSQSLRARLRRVYYYLQSGQIKSKSIQERIHILSLSCVEINTIAKELKPHGITVINYTQDSWAITEKDAVYANTDLVIDKIESDAFLQELICEGGISYLSFLMSLIRILIDQTDRYIKAHDTCMFNFEKIDFDIGFLQTTAPVALENIFFLNYCEENIIPVVCWMHGGYGGYKSLAGYDTTDYRHCRNHVLYGEAAKESIADSYKYINGEGAPIKHVMEVSGSPRLLKTYEHRNPIRTKKKKTIILTIGNFFSYNRFYFGYNRPYAEFCNYESHKAIIEILCRYSDQFEIIIKDYPHNNLAQLWKSILKLQKNNDIKIITNEMTYSDTIKSADVAIFTWLSTSFIEALHTDGNIFLFDDSAITDGARQVLTDSICFEDNLFKFLERLESYLKSKILPRQNKAAAMKYFINGNSMEKNVSNILKFCEALTNQESKP